MRVLSPGFPTRPRRQKHVSRQRRLRGGRGCPSRRHLMPRTFSTQTSNRVRFISSSRPHSIRSRLSRCNLDEDHAFHGSSLTAGAVSRVGAALPDGRGPAEPVVATRSLLGLWSLGFGTYLFPAPVPGRKLPAEPYWLSSLQMNSRRSPTPVVRSGRSRRDVIRGHHQHTEPDRDEDESFHVNGIIGPHWLYWRRALDCGRPAGRDSRVDCAS